MGTPLPLNPSIEGVSVEYDVDHPKPDMYNASAFKHLLSITVKGGKCHVIQFVARTLYDAGSKRFDHTVAWGGRTYSSEKALKFYLDIADGAQSPYYEKRGLSTKTADSLTIYDQPTIGSDGGNRFGVSAGKHTVIARAFCIADGGLLGIVQWERSKSYLTQGKSPSSYRAFSVGATKRLVDWGRDLLKASGFGQPELYIPYQRINLPSGSMTSCTLF